VVACADATEHGFWGEITATAAIARGIVGLVTNGAVRDSDALRRLNFPVFCGGINIRGTSKTKAGSVGECVNLGGVLIRQGDYVVADSDGIVTVPLDAIGSTLEAARVREKKDPIALLTSDYAGTLIAIEKALGPIDSNLQNRLFKENAMHCYFAGRQNERMPITSESHQSGIHRHRKCR
jgi:4-hydroxy-4-methyl-2-oxoglutarate aldolase